MRASASSAMRPRPLLAMVALVLLLSPPPALAAPFAFSTGGTDAQIGIASRPVSAGKGEIEAAGGVGLAAQTTLTGASSTGLLPSAASRSDVQQVRVELYRGFPLDSIVPPSDAVPTRDGSPADVVFDA